MAVLQDFKCPCCDGAIGFDSALQKMKCPYCDTEFDVETIKTYNQDLNIGEDQMEWDTEPGSQWTVDETTGLRSYQCNSCGGEIVGDETLGATSCPFCGNAVVMTEQFAGVLKPDLVIPFMLSKEQAKAALHQHYKKKVLLPKTFKDMNHIDEIKGIYVPFWLFDADADADIKYRATRVRTWSDSRYYYTETKYYQILRGGVIGFDCVPVDGSSKMADDLMESIEPFNMSGAVNFEKAYLAGYLADKYDVDSKQSIVRANQRIKKSTEDSFAATVRGYSSVNTTSSSVRLSNSRAKYALYPVWLLNTTWNGNNYHFVMNGQTGKFAGNLPMDKAAFWRWFGGITGAVSALVFGLSYLLWWL